MYIIFKTTDFLAKNSVCELQLFDDCILVRQNKIPSN